MVNCCVVGCKSNNERQCENITFHRFPKNLELRDAWIKCTGRDNWTPQTHTRMCSNHFNESCFRKTQHKTFLDKISVPTLHIHRQHPTKVCFASLTDEPSTSTSLNLVALDSNSDKVHYFANSTRFKMSTVCRVCVAGNVTLHSLENTQLKDTFEKLSNSKFDSEDARPRAVCSFCYQKLLRSHIFSKMAQQSEEIFSKLAREGHQATHETITELNLGMAPHLSISPLQFYTHVENNVTSSENHNESSSKYVEISVKQEREEEFVNTETVKSEECIERQLIKDGSNVNIDNTSHDITITVKEERISDDEEFVEVEVERISDNEVKRVKQEEIEEMTEEDPLENSLACYVCGKEFASKSKLNGHMRIHSDKNPFACNVCGKKCSRKPDLKVHMRTHTGDRPIPCSVCNKHFYTKALLDRHMMIHTGEKPFPCKVCNKTFYNKSNLDRHVGTHKKEKPFPCSVCGKRYTQKHVLIVHMRIHTGERPFPCNECDKQFYSKSHLVQHMRHHKGEKPFACNVCDKQFFQKSYLIKHTMKHMKEKPKETLQCSNIIT